MDASDDIIFISRSRELTFSDPVEIISVGTVDEVKPSLERVAKGVSQGLYAAGFLAYESAPAFDQAMKTHEPGRFPLLWFGLYKTAKRHSITSPEIKEFDLGPWKSLISTHEYHDHIHRIRGLIAEGDTYQVNYTFPMRAEFKGDTLSWFRQLRNAQQADYCAFIRAGRFHILSASPELFFRLKENTIESRPMKGTRPRGRWPEEDRNAAASLAASEKDRAENVMIVDLLRNDMGRISEFGSVRVRSLFDIEPYPTVWQMTSTIISRTQATVPEIMSALFPCGSVTGAPKIRTMEIIRELEPFPRGVYCGTIGWWAPDGQAEFNVAIRTVTVDIESGQALYHVGGGITYGSSAEDEYDECQTKAALLNRHEPEFELIESIRLDKEYFLLNEHMERLAKSADYFGFSLDRSAVKAALAEKARSIKSSVSNDRSARIPQKVRLLVKQNGSLRIEAKPISSPIPMRIGFAAQPIDESNVFLFHKTTYRTVYEQALASRPECDDVLLWNRCEEITESSIANVVLDIDGQRLTPPVRSGLLQGTFRRYLIDRGEIHERVLTRDDVARAQSIHLINSVRKWIKVQWIDCQA